MRLIFSAVITLFFISVVFSVSAQNKILINEFLIDPQPQSVEILNFGTESADISDWIIDDSGGTTFYTIPKNNVIFPNQCLVYSGDFNLNKTSNDTVRLINSSQQFIDSFSYKSSSGSGISYFRQPDGADFWTTGSASLGFYNQTNISCLATPTPTTTPTPTDVQTPNLGVSTVPTPTEIQTPTPIPTPTPQSYDNIYISEAMVNPATGEKEWVEIYNNNDFSVSLNNWYIDDLENSGSSPKNFSIDLNAKGYGIFDLTSSIFNNDGDSVRLLDFSKNLKDDFEYGKTEQEKTLGRTVFDSDDFCLQESSKNSANNSCINSTPSVTPILSVTIGRINPSPTKNVIPTKTLIYTGLINQTPTKETYSLISHPYPMNSPNILGLSTSANNNTLLINLLAILSTSYSLLTIISILFKMKLSHGKIKKIYLSPLRSS